jgi:integrase
VSKQRWRNRVLERGVVIDRARGYVYVRYKRQGIVRKELIGRVSGVDVVDRANFRAQQIRHARRAHIPGFEGPKQRLLLEDAADLFLKLHGEQRESLKGVEQFRRYVRLIKDKWAGRYVDTLSATDMAEYRRWRKEPRSYIVNGRTKESSAGDSTINREQTAIVTMFNRLAEWRRSGRIPPNVLLPEENPGRGVKKVNEDRYIRTRLVSDEEFRLLLDRADERMRRIILAEINLPLRLEDLKRLSKNNVDSRLGQFKGVQAKTGREYALPINEALRELIRTAPGEKILDFEGFEGRWKRLVKQTGLRGLQFRDLRRTAATALHDGGEKLRTISAMLGHGAVTTTTRYLGLKDENLQHAGELLAAKYLPLVANQTAVESVPKSVSQEAKSGINNTSKTDLFVDNIGGVAQLVRAAAS